VIDTELAEISIRELQEMADKGYTVSIEHGYDEFRGRPAYIVTVHTNDDEEILVVSAPLTTLVNAIEGAYRQTMVYDEYIRKYAMPR
jgi:hypothetical protein